MGSSPADIVYGEGLSVPGETHPSQPASHDELARQRASALADARIKVARLQPIPTLAHRKPLVHMPQELGTCTHVFVRRAPIGTTLSAPYMGPFRVIDRNEQNFVIAVPGRSNETVAISRIKPVFTEHDDSEAAAPPPRPPVGRPPRPRPGPTGPRRRNHRRGRSQSGDEDEERPPL